MPSSCRYRHHEPIGATRATRIFFFFACCRCRWFTISHHQPDEMKDLSSLTGTRDLHSQVRSGQVQQPLTPAPTTTSCACTAAGTAWYCALGRDGQGGRCVRPGSSFCAPLSRPPSSLFGLGVDGTRVAIAHGLVTMANCHFPLFLRFSASVWALVCLLTKPRSRDQWPGG